MGATAVRATGVTPRSERSAVRRFFDDLGYILFGFPLAVASFAVLVALLSTSGSLIIVWVGLPLLVLTLYVARGFASVERWRLTRRGVDFAPAVYTDSAPGTRWWRRTVDHLSDRQYWLDVVHGVLCFPLATFTWAMTVAWAAFAVGGLTSYLWVSIADPGADGESIVDYLLLRPGDPVAEFLHWTPTDAAVGTVLGAFALATVVPLVKLLVVPQAGMARLLLANDRIAELQAKVERLRLRQALAADTAVSDRQRLERDIHDGPQQRLVRLGMDLAAAERRIDQDPVAAKELLAEARAQANAALEELRLLSRGIAPPLLSDRGLGAALDDLGARSAVPVTVDVQLAAGERLPSRVENAVYFTAAEALTNVAKHAEASAAWITVEQTGGPSPVVRLEVVDDGLGGADPTKGHGLAGLRDRVELVDGNLFVTSPPGGPTRLVAEVPCAS